MKKRVLALFMCTVMAAGMLIGCGATEEAPAKETAATEATTAVAEVEITFDWGTVTGGDNPYTYFNEKNPRENTTVAKYLNGNALADTVEDATDATAKTIRYKDLASRMISYLRDHVNTGLQFSITLSEGAKKVVNAQG